MKFDTIIIGGGLAGLLCGIRLAKQGQRCAIVSSGQSALHFSSGSFDLLNALPDGSPVEYPLEALEELSRQSPAHPYAKIGAEKFAELAPAVRDFLLETGVGVVGDWQKNHYRISPFGTLKPTWLTFDVHPQLDSCEGLPWKKAAIFNVVGFLDFYTQFIADEFRKLGTDCSVHFFNFQALEHLRKNPSEMRSANIARVFDQTENLDELIRFMKAEGGDSEILLLPAILGLNGSGALDYIQKQAGKTVRVLSTLPPSVPGLRAQQQLRHCFQEAGGVYMLGDTVLRAEREGNRIAKLYSYNHGDIPFVGNNIVLASGSYFSQGVVATPDGVYEPVFGLDVAYSGDRGQWYDLNLFSKQAYQSFGVKTDEQFHGMLQGKSIDNLYVAGAVLEGFNPIKEGCGAGVSMLSALYIAEQILKQ